MPPESLFDRKYTTASDVWSFGIVVWEVYTFGTDPYPDMGIEEAVRAVARGYRMPRPDLCPHDL